MPSMTPLLLLLLAPLAPPVSAVPVAHPVLRLRSEFAITVRVPLELAVGLFGGHGERVWAGEDWDPRFLRPLPPQDREGSIFLVDSGDRERLGLTTVFDRARGHVRHVFVLGDRCVTVIDIHLAALDPATSRVAVVYERTALSPMAEDEVWELASGDAAQASEWEAAINAAAASIIRQGQATKPEDAAGPPASGGGPASRTSAAGVDWFAIPVAFYMPETRLGLGGMGGAHFRFRPPLPTSDIQLIATGTARQQALFGLTTQLFPSEKLALGGVFRLSRYPDFFHGIGNDTPERAKESFTSRSVEVQLSPEWYLVPGRLRAGPRAWFRQESFQGFAPAGQLASGAIPGIEDYTAAGLGWSVTWDTRDSRFYPKRGNAVEVWYLLSRRFAEGGLRFGRGALDARQFLPLAHRLVLGVSGHLELAHGEVPLTLLPRLGGDRNLRGYFEGRWRDRCTYSGQAELRFPVVGRLGGAVFAGVSDVAPRVSGFGTRTIRPAGGAGARFRLTDDGLNVRIDVGAGGEGANVYLNLGEAF